MENPHFSEPVPSMEKDSRKEELKQMAESTMPGYFASMVFSPQEGEARDAYLKNLEAGSNIQGTHFELFEYDGYTIVLEK